MGATADQDGTSVADRAVRPNKNPAHRRRTGFQEICLVRFRRGNESCVHRFDCPGGGPFSTACCRVVFAHSLPQETSAGRNL